MARNKALTATEGPVPDRGAKRPIGTLPTSYGKRAASSTVAFLTECSPGQGALLCHSLADAHQQLAHSARDALDQTWLGRLRRLCLASACFHSSL
jgi:hypothetical protein